MRKRDREMMYQHFGQLDIIQVKMDMHKLNNEVVDLTKRVNTLTTNLQNLTEFTVDYVRRHEPTQEAQNDRG